MSTKTESIPAGERTQKRESHEETGHTPGLSERIIQNWFSGIPSPELTRLADSAPQLLEALNALIKSSTVNGQQLTIMPSCEAWAKARAAITKAEGRQP